MLSNHKIYNQNREEEQNSYYQFHNEEDLIGNGENAESAFNRHLKEIPNKLQQMLRMQESVQKKTRHGRHMKRMSQRLRW